MRTALICKNRFCVNSSSLPKFRLPFRKINVSLMQEIKHDLVSKYYFKKLQMRKKQQLYFRSQDGESMDKHEFELWPQVTRFKLWKTSFRREVATASIHPQQVTDWLSDFAQATSMRDSDDAGIVFGSARIVVDTLDSQKAKGLVKITNAEFKREIRVAHESHERKGSPCGQEDRSPTRTAPYFKNSDVHG